MKPEKTMDKYQKITSKKGEFWTFTEKSIKWYAPYHSGETQPHPRALWCRTQREAIQNDHAANVAI